MNICFLAYFPMIPYVGGVQRVTTLLSRELSRRGHDIVYLCHNEKYKDQIDDPDIEYPQYYIDISDSDVESTFCDFLSDNKIDIVVCQEQGKETLKLLALIPDSVKVISVCHTMPFAIASATRKSLWKEFPNNTFRLALCKLAVLVMPSLYVRYVLNSERDSYYKVLEYSDKFVFLTETSFPRVLKQMPDFPKNKLVAINNPNTFDLSQSDFYAEKKNIVLWVGRVDYNKNCLDFLKVWRAFFEKHPDWEAVIAGDGPELNTCKKWAKSHSLKNISFLGYYKDVDKLYREAKVFVSTSYSEGWGMTLTESMSRGCVPCVYNTFDALADIVENDVNGLLCEPYPEVLAKRLQALVANESQMKKMSMTAAKSLMRFSSSNIGDDWEKLFNVLFK